MLVDRCALDVRSKLTRLLAGDVGSITLQGEEQRQFVSLGMPKTGMMRDAQHFFASGDVGYSSRPIELANFDTCLAFGDDCGTPKDKLSRVAGSVIGEISRIAVNSDSRGENPDWYAPGNMTTIDGWRAKAESGNVYDHQGDGANQKLFSRMLDMCSPDIKSNPRMREELCFYCSDVIGLRFFDWLSADISGDFAPRFFFGEIPVVPDSAVELSIPGRLAMAEECDKFTWVMLTTRTNLVMGWGPMMIFYLDGNRLSIRGQFDVQFYHPEFVISGKNVSSELFSPMMDRINIR